MARTALAGGDGVSLTMTQAARLTKGAYYAAAASRRALLNLYLLPVFASPARNHIGNRHAAQKKKKLTCSWPMTVARNAAILVAYG